jgi:hypothetical protein
LSSGNQGVRDNVSATVFGRADDAA